MTNELIATIFRSIHISGMATVLASLWSIPLSYLILFKCKRKTVVEAIIESFVGMPTVLLGLLLYLLFSSSGPLGFLGLLYTPSIMIIGESILITPTIISVYYRSIKDIAPLYHELALTLGANPIQRMELVLSQTKLNIMASCIMGFSRALGELGVAMMVGGNIKGSTRVITTAIALEVAKGNFEEALALGGVLLLITISISLLIRIIIRVRTL